MLKTVWEKEGIEMVIDKKRLSTPWNRRIINNGNSYISVPSVACFPRSNYHSGAEKKWFLNHFRHQQLSQRDN